MKKTGLLAAALFAFSAAAEGIAMKTPGVLYDAPSEQARPLFILTAGYPLRQISRVDGWRKVGLHTGENGWVRENDAAPKKSAVVSAETAAVRFSPSPDAAEVFYARRGVVLNIVGENGGWTEVSHQDGETGFVNSSDLWTNL